jgi:hypothetical protein
VIRGKPAMSATAIRLRRWRPNIGRATRGAGISERTMASKRRAAGDRTFREVIAAGNTRESLEAMRDELAAAMAQAPATVIAQIAARLQAVIEALDALPKAKKVTRADQLAKQRTRRRAAAASGASARRRGGQ